MSDYQFVSTDTSEIMTQMISAYESITGHTLKPADPDRLFLSWVASVIVRERVSQNYVGNQNIPSRSSGENLDALGEWIFNVPRNPAKAAICDVQFNISAAQSTSIIIPAGTRVSDISRELVWETTEEAIIPIGNTSVVVQVRCQQVGEIGNGYAVGQIDTLIDVDNVLYYTSCANIDESAGGTDAESDDEYYQRLRKSLDAYSTAGSIGAYEYWAKSVSDDIGDVAVIRPMKWRTEEAVTYADDDDGVYLFIGGNHLIIDSLVIYPDEAMTLPLPQTSYTVTYDGSIATIKFHSAASATVGTSYYVKIKEDFGGQVEIYAIMADGTPAPEVIKQQIEKKCNDKFVRPLTDTVSVKDPGTQEYSIRFTFYMDEKDTTPANEMEERVRAATNQYIEWQSAKFGRDINPSKLISLVMATGVKRVEVFSPEYMYLNDGGVIVGGNNEPVVAQVLNVSITNGGYEDE